MIITFEKIKRSLVCLCFGMTACSVSGTDTAPKPIFNTNSIHQPVVGERGMIVSQNHYATEVGAEILNKGGNAIDAAVATTLALSVTLPRTGSLGGGGFMVVHLAGENRNLVIDYRPVAPLKSHPAMFKGADDDTIWYSHLSTAVPGSVAALAHTLEKYGTMSWAEVIEPAIKLAEEGYAVTYNMSQALESYHKLLSRHPATRQSLLKENGDYYRAGEILRQPVLARTLKTLRDNGPGRFL